MRLLLLLFLSLLIGQVAKTQQLGPVKIRLKNGTLLKGKILGTLEENKALIRLGDEEVMGIPYEDIARIRFGKYGRLPKKLGGRNLDGMPFSQNSRFFHSLHLGMMLENYGDPQFTIQQVNGYFLKPWLGVGLGLGYDRYSMLHVAPVTARVQGYIFQKKLAPFYFADLGYGHAWVRNFNAFDYDFHRIDGGLVWQVGFGYQLNFSNTALSLGLAFKNQASYLDYTIVNNWWGGSNVEVTEDLILRRAVLTIGLSL